MRITRPAQTAWNGNAFQAAWLLRITRRLCQSGQETRLEAALKVLQ